MASTESLLDAISGLPNNIRDQVKLYALSSPVKNDLRDHFDRRDTEMRWWRVSEDWLSYVEELEYFSTITGNPMTIDEDGLGDLLYHSWARRGWWGWESLKRVMPIQYACCVEDKETILLGPQWGPPRRLW